MNRNTSFPMTATQTNANRHLDLKKCTAGQPPPNLSPAEPRPAPTLPDPDQAATVSGYSRDGMHEIRTPKTWHLWV